MFAKVEGDSRFLSMVEKDGGWYRVANRIAASAAKVIEKLTILDYLDSNSRRRIA